MTCIDAAGTWGKAATCARHFAHVNRILSDGPARELQDLALPDVKR
ncbi:hypothetical protein [Streptomyces sp. NPDC057199]